MRKSIRYFIVAASLLLACVSIYSFGQSKDSSADINWMSFEEAVAASKKNPKKILIDVYTDWCGWCKKLDNVTYKDPALVAYVNKHYYAVKLDAEMSDTIHFKEHTFVNPKPGERRSAHQLAISLLDGQMSYPTTIILDEGFNRPTPPIKGYLDQKAMLPILRFFGDDAYKTTSWEDYQRQASN